MGSSVPLKVRLQSKKNIVNYTWWRNSDQIYTASSHGSATVTYVVKVGLGSNGVYSFSTDGESIVVASLLVIGEYVVNLYNR